VRGVELMKECKPQRAFAGPGLFGRTGVRADLGVSEHTEVLTWLVRRSRNFLML
jgi:hypothetical protein